MKPDRRSILASLKSHGLYKADVGDASVTIKLLRKGYHIIVARTGQRPLTYVYRDEKVAVDRLFEQVDFLRRDR